MITDILSELVITNVYSASTMYNEITAVRPRENRPCWAIILKYEGETVYTANGQKYISNAGSVVILPKGSSYDWQCTKSGHYSIIEFESDLILKEIICLPTKSADKVLKYFNELEYKRMMKKTMFELESIRDLYSLILTLLQNQPSKYYPSSKFDKITPALDYIAKHYNTKITNDELAILSGLSTVYFRKLFKGITGKSPINYICSLRLEKAKEMLASDYSSISDISLILGYQNIYDFSRAFKKYVGMSPIKYKEYILTL